MDNSSPFIPSRFPTLLGDIPVTRSKANLKDSEGLIGKARLYSERSIQIASGVDPMVASQTFWHEVFHLFLSDSGLKNFIPSKVEEALCDSFGVFMANAQRSGAVHLTGIEAKEVD
jgi:hypothetical protein